MKISRVLLIFAALNSDGSIFSNAWGASLLQALDTSGVLFYSPPPFLKASRLERVVEKMESKLEWDLRKIHAQGYATQSEFEKFHGFGPLVLAVTRPEDGSIHVGPKVKDSEFDSVFGHELVHVILLQKYKSAIPKWIEEGLANYLSGHGTVDYPRLSQALSKLAQVPDVRSLNHPFGANSTGSAFKDPVIHYQFSRAALEMIASRCPFNELLQLSVGKSLESYLSTFCSTQDLNADLKKWIEKKAKSRAQAPSSH